MEAVLAWYPLSYGEVNPWQIKLSRVNGIKSWKWGHFDPDTLGKLVAIASHFQIPGLQATYVWSKVLRLFVHAWNLGFWYPQLQDDLLCLCAKSDKLCFISSWHMSVFFLLSLLTLSIYLQKWIKHEIALVTPSIRVSTHGQLNIITTTRDDALHAARQTVHPLYPKENIFPPSNRWYWADPCQ